MMKEILCQDCRRTADSPVFAYDAGFIPAATDSAGAAPYRPESIVKVCPYCHSRRIVEVLT